MTAETVSNVTLPDPADVSDSVSRIADQSRELIAEYLTREGADPSLGMGDMSSVGTAFLDMTTKLMMDPGQLANAQLGLWQDYLTLWQNSAAAMLGQKGDSSAASGDRRFKHADWEENVFFDFVKQAYLLTARWVQTTVREVEGLDEKTAKKVDFYTRQFVDALSPTNFVLTNPEVIRATADTGGQNLLKGLTNLLDDLKRGKGQLAIKMTDLDAFELGKNVATTPGKVVYQNDLMQLLQYNPTTEQVHERPLLIVPPLDQQVLHSRPPAQEFIHQMVCRPRPHGVRHILGKSRRATFPQELRRLHAGRSNRCPRGDRAGHRREKSQCRRLLLGWDAAVFHAGLPGGEKKTAHRERDVLYYHARLLRSRGAGGFHR